MWNQAKQPRHGFAIRHRLITNIGFTGSANESSRVARPNIVLAHVNGWFNSEVPEIAFTLLDGLVMTAHGLILEIMKLSW
jgi:hypothetical protein